MSFVPNILIGLAAGASLIVAAAVSTSAHDRTSERPVERLCELTSTAVPGGTRLEARVFPRAAMSGSYAVTIRDTTRAGSASIDQSGDFSATGETVLSEIELSTAGRKLVTDFTLRSGGKTYVCPLRIAPTSL